MFEGEIYPTNNGDCKVIKIFNSRNITVRFIATGYVKHGVVARNLDVGEVKDPLHPSVYGKGCVGIGEFKPTISGKQTTTYVRWINMLQRCYYEEHLRRQPTYRGCSVCTSWLNFQNFAKWWYENAPDVADISKFHLDKDIKVEDNKCYSPETCSIVHESVNVEHSSLSKGFMFFISPEGVKWPAKNLSKFAREHGLDPSSLSRIVSGARMKHKGWRLA